MIYVMSDLHGCYDKYIEMLKKIQLKEDDICYILGDFVDRGEHGIKILLDLMKRRNIIPILGNHDYMAYYILNKMNVEISDEFVDEKNISQILEMYNDWMSDGGNTTINEFKKLSNNERNSVLDFISEFDVYEEITIDNCDFLLCHAGLENFSVEKDLEEYCLDDFLFARTDYNKIYYEDKIIVSGHTPTFMIDEAYSGKILRKNNHIAIDCGVVYGKTLGCICLDTMEEFYV